MIGLLLTAALGALIWYAIIKPMSYWKDRGVKQTKPWPFFGDSWVTVFRRLTIYDFVVQTYKMYPNVRYSGCYQFTTPTLFVRDLDLIKQITVKDFDHFEDHRTIVDSEADPLLGDILFSLKGNRWREMRATLSGSYTSSKMKSIFYLIEEAAENFVQYFLDKNEDVIELELKDAYTRFTNDVIASAAFGIKVDSLKEPNNEFYQKGKVASNFIGLKRMFTMFGYMVMPKIFKLLKVSLLEKDIGIFFRTLIDETIKTREKKGIVRPDMIHLLLEARKGIKHEEKEALETGFATVKESSHVGKVKHMVNLTNEKITSQALIFFIAGFDTVSTAMCFSCYQLALRRDVQDRLREEIKETFKTNNGQITYDVLLKMKYLDMVISEVLRIWPPVTFTDRVCTKPYTIEPVTPDEKPVHLKVGNLIWIPIFALHMDPAYYPNPDKFDPERFSDENKGNIKSYTYLPFGSGPRNCIGSRFALLEIKALLFNLLLNFEIVPSNKTQIPIKLLKSTQIVHTEQGFWFTLNRIKN